MFNRFFEGIGDRALLVVTALVVLFLALYPVGWLIWGSFYSAPPYEDGQFTLDNYLRAFTDPKLGRMLWDTLVFALGQMAVAVGVGTALGWIVGRTNTPGRGIFELLILFLFLFPIILAVVAWTMLLSPGKGLVNALLRDLFGLTESPFDIYSLGGMIFVQGLYLAPLAYLMIVPAFRSIDTSLEEASRISGAGWFRTFRHITLPLTRPAVLASALLLFIFGLESFEVPQMLGAQQGVYTYTTLIYNVIAEFYPADYGKAAALSSLLLLASAVGIYFYRRTTARDSQFQTIRGKNFRGDVIDLGPWRWVTFAFCILFFGLTVILPTLVLVLGSLLNYYGSFDADVFDRMTVANYARVLAHPQLVNGFTNSLLLAIFGGLACVLFAVVVGYLVTKTRARGRGLVDAVAMLPISFPATVLGVALLWAWITVPLPVYGTLLILAIAFITRYLPIALRTVSSGLMQISDELEEASRVAGASLRTTLVRIVLPLLAPALVAAWLMMFMIFMRELSMSILLAGPGNPVAPVVMYDYYTSGELGPLSAAALMYALVIVLVMVAARQATIRLGGRFEL